MLFFVPAYGSLPLLLLIQLIQMQNIPGQEGVATTSKWKKVLSLLVKTGITLLCFWYINQKIDWRQAGAAMQKANPFYLAFAVLLYFLSKLLSSIRLNFYFRNIGLRLSEWVNGKLYWMGMFYNLFLPGAISGDAYKVILLHRRFDTPYKKGSAAVLIDRFSGLLALALLLAGYALIVIHERWWDAAFVLAALGAVGGLYLLIRYFFSDFLASFWPALFWGLAVQGIQVVCIYALLYATAQPLLPEWIFIFLVTSVVSVLPLSLGGGLGTRELVFAEGAVFFGLDPAIAVVISLLFYCCNLVTSVWGVYYTFRDPLAE